MDFGLPEMQVIALIGLLGIASLAAWNSAILWRRQRALEQVLADLLSRLTAPEQTASASMHEAEESELAPPIAQLVEMLQAVDRSALDAMLHPPFDLPRTPAFEVDDVPATGPRFGFTRREGHATWEA